MTEEPPKDKEDLDDEQIEKGISTLLSFASKHQKIIWFLILLIALFIFSYGIYRLGQWNTCKQIGGFMRSDWFCTESNFTSIETNFFCGGK